MDGEQSLVEKLMGVTNPAGSRNGMRDIECKMSPQNPQKSPKHVTELKSIYCPLSVAPKEQSQLSPHS